MKDAEESDGTDGEDNIQKFKQSQNKEKIGLFNRVNIDQKQFLSYGPKIQDDMVKKKLANELKPAQIKHSMQKVDQAFSSLLTANQEFPEINYGMGYYVNEPQVLRGIKQEKLHEMELLNEEFNQEKQIKEQNVVENDNPLEARIKKNMFQKMQEKGIILVNKAKPSKVTFLAAHAAEQRRKMDMQDIEQVRGHKEYVEQQQKNLQNQLVEQANYALNNKPPLPPLSMQASIIKNNTLQVPGSGRASYRSATSGVMNNSMMGNNQPNASMMMMSMAGMHRKSNSAQGQLQNSQTDIYQYNVDPDNAHHHTQSLAALKEAQIKISLKRPDPLSVTQKPESLNPSPRSNIDNFDAINIKSQTQKPSKKSKFLRNQKDDGPIFEIQQTRHYEDNVILIKPQIDASDKEIYAKNGYRTASKNVVNFLESGNRGEFIEHIFKPKYLGDFTSDNMGVIKSINKNVSDPDFQLSYKKNNKNTFAQTPNATMGKSDKLGFMFNDQQGGNNSTFKGRGGNQAQLDDNNQQVDKDGSNGKNNDPWMRLDLKNSPESLFQNSFNQQQRKTGGPINNKNQYYKSSVVGPGFQDSTQYQMKKQSQIIVLDRNKRERKMLKNMQSDNIASQYDPRQGMKIVREESDEDEDDEDALAKKRKARNSHRSDKKRKNSDDSSELSEFEQDKIKQQQVQHNNFADYNVQTKQIDPSTLKKGEFLSKGGKIVKPNREDERSSMKKQQVVGEADLEDFRQKELLREKLKNQNIMREVLKKQVKDFEEARKYHPNDEIEALLIEKYKKEAKKIKNIGKKEDQQVYIRRQALIDKILLMNNNSTKSLAERKRLWIGENGQFQKKDLAKWYKVYNQTKLAEMKEIFNKDKDGYELEALYD